MAKTKTSPARAKEPSLPKARAVSGVVDVLATVHAKAKMLSEALPYMQRYEGKTVVGNWRHALGVPRYRREFRPGHRAVKQAG